LKIYEYEHYLYNICAVPEGKGSLSSRLKLNFSEKIVKSNPQVWVTADGKRA